MIEIQDIFWQHGKEYRLNHKLLPNQVKAMFDIENCRTAILGSYSDVCDQWIPSRKKFFIPVKVLSRKFRGKFLSLLQQSDLSFHGSMAELQNNQVWDSFLSTQYHKEWIVYCKPPFKSSAKVVEYLARYTHRVAISNNRILKLENGFVTFKWRDYRNGNKQKLMTLAVDEFIRRFLMHVLPSRFTKIRHYGLLSSRTKSLKLKLCKQLTNTLIIDKPKEKLPAIELLKKLTGKDVTLCPSCGIGHLSRASPDRATA